MGNRRTLLSSVPGETAIPFPPLVLMQQLLTVSMDETPTLSILPGQILCFAERTDPEAPAEGFCSQLLCTLPVCVCVWLGWEWAEAEVG